MTVHSAPSAERRPHPLPPVLALGVQHAIALGTIVFCWDTGWALAALALHVAIAGLGLHVGYHRLLTHRSFAVPLWLEHALALLGTLAMQGDPLEWVTIHRQHHESPDRDGDPHMGHVGFVTRHWGWIGRLKEATTPERMAAYAPDLLKDPFYPALRRWNQPLLLTVALATYAALGLQGLLWCIFVRITISYQVMALVNSFGHGHGSRSFDTADDSTNCSWVGVISFGEGWHNNHHAHPRSARLGLEPWQLDLGWLAIRAAAAVGLATRVVTPTAAPPAAPR